MQAMISNVLEQPLLFGLDWYDVAPSIPEGATAKAVNKARKKEFDALLKTAHAAQYIGVKKGQDFVMLGATSRRMESKNGVSPAALLFARALEGECGIAIAELDEDAIWICGVDANLPIPDLDHVVDRAEAGETLTRAFEAFSAHEVTPTVFIEGQYSNELAFKRGIETQSLIELVSSIRLAKADVMAKASAGEVSPIVAVLTSIAFFGALGGGYYWYQAKQKAEEEEQARLRAAQEKPEIAYARAFATWFNQSPRAGLKDLILNARQQIDPISLGVDGWAFNDFSCFANTQSCLTTLDRLPFAPPLNGIPCRTKTVFQRLNDASAECGIKTPISRIPPAITPEQLASGFSSQIWVETALPWIQQTADLGCKVQLSSHEKLPIPGQKPGGPLQITAEVFSISCPLRLIDLLVKSDAPMFAGRPGAKAVAPSAAPITSGSMQSGDLVIDLKHRKVSVTGYGLIAQYNKSAPDKMNQPAAALATQH